MQLFSLLSANPKLLDLVATIMGSAPRLAEIVARRAHVMDAILEPAFFGEMPDAGEVERRLAASLGEARAYEEALDRARIFTKEQQFLIGVRVISGTLSARRAGEAYARLADAILRQITSRVGAEFERVHGRIDGGRLALVAMGRLGGMEMTASSDLDLILLYDHAPGAEASDGPRPLAPTQYYARLTQRLVAALTAPTAEGKLYEVDFRLRPSGNAGPLATHVEAFARYHDGEAWTWEHMALTRARPVAGSAELGAEVAAIVARTLARPREADAILADIADMRARVEHEFGSRDPWDLKRVAGGIFDIDFIAQALQLVHGAAHPEILATSTEESLSRARDAGLLDAAAADVILPAIRLYNDLAQVIRVALPGPFKPAEAPRGVLELVARAGATPDVARLEVLLVDTEAAVRATFERLVGKVERRGGDAPKR
ncbi:DUF294 nucleotidyltransferase-like domain-containing protein [Methylobrevis pamukkalensis]|uniref:Glutamate-ammonia-ligase adenylyltransferase n=1 Tax=Methylobrevis pamukkalensis TaxID=1439726 RepID=A0A1E3H2M3_9HYPH|nr:DUF294 nucleotidyltransferase-like domain-containing protein [Methylobrevis pamukkalensis]ODN70568.1 Glutamate-ammonia-ligase adenylyltransferase [Methylobrevis pamukkalensis]